MTGAPGPATVVAMIERLRGMDRRTIAAVAVTGIALAAVPAWSYVQARQPLPDRGLTPVDPRALDDGYHHLVVAVTGAPTVTPPDPGAAPEPTAEPAATTAAPAAGAGRTEVPL